MEQGAGSKEHNTCTGQGTWRYGAWSIGLRSLRALELREGRQFQREVFIYMKEFDVRAEMKEDIICPGEFLSRK
jgi:hypothetical protein